MKWNGNHKKCSFMYDVLCPIHTQTHMTDTSKGQLIAALAMQK